MFILGFAGKKRHGKDTACDAIIEARGKHNHSAYHTLPLINKLLPKTYDIRKFGFGDLVRDEVGYWYPNKIHDRLFLQNWGASRREEYAHYWILKMDALVLHYHPEVVLISGVRFKDEADWIHSYGGYVDYLIRNGFDDPEPGQDDVTEQFDPAWADIVSTIRDGGIAAARKSAVGIFDGLIEKGWGE